MSKRGVKPSFPVPAGPQAAAWWTNVPARTTLPR
jgi:hypothetical protein